MHLEDAFSLIHMLQRVSVRRTLYADAESNSSGGRLLQNESSIIHCIKGSVITGHATDD
jgi:hypothetical protein